MFVQCRVLSGLLRKNNVMQNMQENICIRSVYVRVEISDVDRQTHLELQRTFVELSTVTAWQNRNFDFAPNCVYESLVDTPKKMFIGMT